MQHQHCGGEMHCERNDDFKIIKCIKIVATHQLYVRRRAPYILITIFCYRLHDM